MFSFDTCVIMLIILQQNLNEAVRIIQGILMKRRSCLWINIVLCMSLDRRFILIRDIAMGPGDNKLFKVIFT